MPKRGEFRVAISILALIIVLGFSFAAYYVYKKVGIDEPLEKKLTSIQGVEKISVQKGKDVYSIDVKLKKVDNLQNTYMLIDETVQESLTKQPYTLHMSDQPNEHLKEFAQHMQPAIYESLANNRFIWLDQEIDKRTKEQGIQYKFFVDQEHLFVQIQEGDYYLYQVINRGNTVPTNAVQSQQG